MPGRKRPTPEDAMTACRVLLDGLARDADICGLAPCTPRAAGMAAAATGASAAAWAHPVCSATASAGSPCGR
jgi:hypothetical protein